MKMLLPLLALLSLLSSAENFTPCAGWTLTCEDGFNQSLLTIRRAVDKAKKKNDLSKLGTSVGKTNDTTADVCIKRLQDFTTQFVNGDDAEAERISSS